MLSLTNFALQLLGSLRCQYILVASLCKSYHTRATALVKPFLESVRDFYSDSARADLPTHAMPGSHCTTHTRHGIARSCLKYARTALASLGRKMTSLSAIATPPSTSHRLPSKMSVSNLQSMQCARGTPACRAEDFWEHCRVALALILHANYRYTYTCMLMKDTPTQKLLVMTFFLFLLMTSPTDMQNIGKKGSEF